MGPDDSSLMRRAIQLARRGEGAVEPNPAVGCVIVNDGTIVGEGWHQRFGGPHAEVEAIEQAGDRARGGTMLVTLEPCSHYGKTPPCTDAIAAAGIKRVLVAQQDPFEKVAGSGLAALRRAGLTVELGIEEGAARELNAPYRKLIVEKRPWVIAKWAMTLDGKIATSSGDSKWISNEQAREVVHRLRGRMDAVIVGRRTAVLDDPQLTARPPGPRQATRIVFASRGELDASQSLVRTAHQLPTIIVVSQDANAAQDDRLVTAGCQLLHVAGTPVQQVDDLLLQLGERRFTNVLVEGGGSLLGSFFEAGVVDEVHVFVAPCILGGKEAVSPVGGTGQARVADAWQLGACKQEQLGDNLYVSGRLRRDYP